MVKNMVSVSKNGIKKQTTKRFASAVSKPSSTGHALSQRLDEEIAKLAYSFFTDRGCQHGFDVEDWKRAEAILKAKSAARLN